MSNSKIILVAGPSGSGKSTIASGLEKQLIAL
jgi:adenylylsulfate kinase-like enzyme